MGETVVERDNRRSYRYQPVQSAVRLGWWREPRFRTAPAELSNISQGGAMMLSSECPSVGESLWVCMDDPTPGDWAEAAVISHGPVDNGLHEVRIKFADACPYEMFSLAVHGISVGH